LTNTSTSSGSTRASSLTSNLSTGLKTFSNFLGLTSNGVETSLPLHDGQINANAQTNVSSLQVGADSLPPELLFLPICYNEGRYATRVRQPELVKRQIQCDQSLFILLREEYQATRGKWFSIFSLRTISWIKFVHFELYRSELVDVRKVDDIPPPDDTEYRYAPVPAHVIPPGMRLFLVSLLKLHVS
jgi:hypothetical protein